MAHTKKYDSVLLIGFGGPTPGCCKKYEPCPGEAYCFVEGIVGTAASNVERVKEVASHYVALGGFSPFNELTFKQADALEAGLKDRGMDVPVYVGMRNWTPYLHEVIENIVKKGHLNILGIVMSAYQSESSWERYQSDVESAIETLDSEPPTVSYLDSSWHNKPGFISAIADRVRTACDNRFDKATLIFTAHAIPQPAAKYSPYTKQFRETALAVAEQLGMDFELAYQSAPDNPTVSWTAPDINDLLRDKAKAGVEDVIVAPIGFLCDHVEVLYDLGIEARATAEECGMSFICAETVGAHSEFIGMLADLVCEKFQTEEKNG